MIELEMLKKQAESVMLELIEVSNIKEGEILVVGCSSSEIVGGCIGKASSLDAAQAVFEGINNRMNRLFGCKQVLCKCAST